MELNLARVVFVCGMVAPAILLSGCCKAKIESDLTVDGAKFDIEECHSGEPLGFAGVALQSSDGRTLRLVATPDGKAEAFVFASGSTTGETVGPCGPFTLTTQNSTVNNVRNVMGEATLNCTLGAHKVTGSVQFENCH